MALNLRILLFTLHFSLFTFFGGCASLLQKENILAVVDGEPITKGDLEYSLQIAHRREDLSSAKILDISQYVQKLIDDRLIVQETQRMGMEQYPEVQEAIQAYIIRESVVRLHDEEVVQKVSVTEEEIIDYYKKNYERFSLGIIEVKTEENAREILEKLNRGGNFKELAKEYSTHASKEDGGEVSLTRRAMGSFLEEAVFSLKPGELSDIIKTRDTYYIVKSISRQEASDEEFENVRDNIEQTIRKQRGKKRGDEYLKYLREKAGVKINQELLSSINLNVGSEEREKWSEDKRPLIEINDLILTVGDFVAKILPATKGSPEKIVNHWIDRKLIDQEALSRHYEMKSDLEGMVDRYKNQLLRETFIKNVIIPGIEISDKALEDYYLSHQEDFVKPARYRIQQITVKSMEEAEDVLNNLQRGADFSWLAKKKSTDTSAQGGGDIGWLLKEHLPESVREIVDTLKIGDISPVLRVDSLYRIIRLQEKTKEEVEELNTVKSAVYKAYFNGHLNNIYNNYVARLKEEAQIKIYSEAVQSFERSLKK